MDPPMERLAEEAHLASCEFGSEHQKEFALLTVAVNARSLGRKCSRTQHIRIEGSLVPWPGYSNCLRSPPDRPE